MADLKPLFGFLTLLVACAPGADVFVGSLEPADGGDVRDGGSPDGGRVDVGKPRPCRDDDDCPRGVTCAHSQFCTQCYRDDMCPDERPLCQEALALCVECLSDRQCGRDRPFCVSDKVYCVECVRDEHCEPDEYCKSGPQYCESKSSH